MPTNVRCYQAARLCQLGSSSLAAVRFSRRAVWTPSELFKKKSPPTTLDRSASDASGRYPLTYPVSSAFWTGVTPSTSPHAATRVEPPFGAPETSAAARHRGTSPAPSPDDFGTYEEYLERYSEELESYKRSAFHAYKKAKHALETIKKEDEETPRKLQREYLWTFVPMMIMMCVYFNDVSDQACAHMLQRQTEEHARLHCPVKWEKL